MTTPTTAPHLPSTIEHIATDALVPYARNSRTHSPEQVAQLGRSIQQFGFTNPVLIDEHNTLIAGHGRVMAAQRIGLAQVPCIRLTHLTDAQRRAYVIADNKLAEQAGWNVAMLTREVEDLMVERFDVSLLGFGDDELAELLGEAAPSAGADGATDVDDVPDVKPDPVTRAGDVWLLGQHRVVCGDSTSMANLGRLMQNVEADMVWTDPPYNVAYETKAGKIANDDLGDAEFKSFLVSAFNAAFAMLKPGGAIYVAHADTEGLNFRAAFAQAGFKLSGCLVWRKNSLVLGRSDYQWQHEPILYGWKPGAAHTWHGGRKQTTILDLAQTTSLFRLRFDGKYEIQLGDSVLIVDGDAKVDELIPSVINEDKPSRNEGHPTMKPVALVERMLKNNAKKGAVVLDLFGGSGSTLMACERLGMKGRLSELDAGYCDVIVKRWQDYTGKVAVLDGANKTFGEVAEIRRATVGV